jgi:hypothetical protein
MPDYIVGLPALSACLFCFVPATSACSSERIFVAATNCTNKPKQGRQYMALINLFNLNSMGQTDPKNAQMIKFVFFIIYYFQQKGFFSSISSVTLWVIYMRFMYINVYLYFVMF